MIKMTRVKLMLIVLVVGMVAFLSSCQSTATQERFLMAQADVASCQTQVLALRSTPQAAPQFKDETNMLLYLVVQELADSKKGDDMDACASSYIAMIRADGAKTNSLINRGFGLAGLGMGVWGAAIITDGIIDLAGQGSNTFNARDITVSNTPGAGSAEFPGGAATMNTNIGGGSIQTLTDGSSIVTAEKQIVNPSVSDSGVVDLNDSLDGANNDASLF